MADRTQENLARIRACDADWNENDHPRADNGQFTSGSGGGGAKVSKLQSGGKAKASSIKAGEIAKNQERYDNAHKSMAANYLSDLTNAVKGGDYETAREKLERHEKDKKRYDQLTAQNNKFKAAKKTLEKAKPGIAKMREQAKAAQPAAKPAKPAKPAKSTAQLENEYKDAFNRYVAFTENAAGLHDLYRNPEIYKQAMQIAKKKAQKAEKAYMKAVEKEEKQAKAGGGVPASVTNSPDYKKQYDGARERVKKIGFYSPQRMEQLYAEAKESLKKWEGYAKEDPTDKDTQMYYGWYRGLVDAYKERMKK